MIQPDEESNFQKEIKGDKISQESKDTFNDTDEGKNDPIRQPLRVFQFVCRINGFERHVRWVNKGHEVCEQFGSSHGEYEGKYEHDSHKKETSLGVTRLCFQLFHLFYDCNIIRTKMYNK